MKLFCGCAVSGVPHSVLTARRDRSCNVISLEGEGVHLNRCPFLFLTGQMMTPGRVSCRGVVSPGAIPDNP
jgi:uncharacterized protein YqkB